ncbi:MAG: cation transporter [Rhodospirillales bacterium]|nr:cation transporter [Rhodospirillales bacterium]
MADTTRNGRLPLGEATHDHTGDARAERGPGEHAHAGHGHAGDANAGDGHDHGGHDHAGHEHAEQGHAEQGHVHGGGGHHHHHHGPPVGNDRAFAIAAAANTGFVVAEIGFGIAANSVALVADAVHNLGDVLALLLGWGAAWLGRRPPRGRRTYGWGRSSILAALLNAAILLVGVGAIAVEAVQRLFDPQPVAEMTVMIVAGLGILVNGGTALLFMAGREKDLNVKAQFLHLGGDALISLGVVVAALAIQVTGLAWIDPLASIGIAIAIAVGTWGLLRESVDLAMDAVPQQVEQAAVEGWLASLPGVVEVHDLHIWGLSTTETALTAHLVCTGEPEDRRPHEVAAQLRQRFGIGHATLQIESADDAALCRLRPNEIV